ncbi:MAG: diguanylate cyclase [Anaerolineaceae bacterium]|nr:diguanylate cyclase [Anaerolineaceae bacterium]MBN2676995.1 diguanylate cyclase [Anaerolineaceae bacterium]
MKEKRKTAIQYLWKALVLIIGNLAAVMLTGVFQGDLNGLSPIWLPAGISIGLVFLWGYSLIPIVFISIFLPLVLSDMPVPAALPTAIVISLETFLAVFLLKRVLHLKPSLTYIRDLAALVIAAILASFHTAGLELLVIHLTGLADASDYISIWTYWWVSDLLGILVMVPVILVWGSNIPKALHFNGKRYDWLAIVMTLLVTWVVFRQQEQMRTNLSVLTYLIFPFLFWTAFRLYQRGATLANLLFVFIVLVMMQYYPLGAFFSAAQSIWILDTFLIATISGSMIMAVLFSEREFAKHEVMNLNTQLEERVAHRTQKLRRVNSQIKQELKSRQSMETELRTSQDNLRTILENLPGAMILINANARIIDINKHMMSLFKVQREEVLNQYKLDDFAAPDRSLDELSGHLQRALDGETVKLEWKARRPSDGSVFPIQLELIRIRLVDEPVIICSITDLTERVKMVEAEREQRVLAEALQNTASALSSVLNLNQVFDRILKNVGKVVPHDAVNLMLIEDGIARIVHSHGYKKLGMLDYIRNVRFDVTQIDNLRIMIESGKPLIIPDINLYPSWVNIDRASWIQSYAAAPIRVKGEVIGFIQLDSGTPGYFSEKFATPLQAFADQAAIAIDNARLYTELQQLAITDSLTGLLNRHGFSPIFKREFEIAHRYDRKLAVIFFDIDRLKNINDRYGHPAGDRSLKMIADCCRSTLREIDLVGRYGGDEFIILLTEADLKSAMEVAARLKRCVEANLFEIGGEKVIVTFSAGVSEIKKGMKSVEELIDAADRGSYRAKSQGRNSIATIQKYTSR